MTDSPTRVLDASALVELFHGHPKLMHLLDAASRGELMVAVPAVARAEAQVVLRATHSIWDHVMSYPGLTELPLSGHGAVDTGDLARSRLEHHPVHPALRGPLMSAQVLGEAVAMRAPIVTRYPELYGGHDVVISPIG